MRLLGIALQSCGFSFGVSPANLGSCCVASSVGVAAGMQHIRAEKEEPGALSQKRVASNRATPGLWIGLVVYVGLVHLAKVRATGH